MSAANMGSIYNEELFRQSGILALIDRDGRYRYVSADWQKTTGIRREDAVGKKVEDLLSGSAAEEALRRRRPVSGVMYYRSSAGRKFTGYIRYIPVLSAETQTMQCIVLRLFEDQSEASSFAMGLKDLSRRRQTLSGSQEGGNAAKYSLDSILGVSPAMRDLKKQIRIAAGIKASCLIEGETGTGKELVAHAIHSHSLRSAFPFVRVNCSAVPENLMESEFFGYEEGSFTGGVKGGRIGKFESANHGSMFLDEINAMPLTMQPKLLRALQEREIERVGGSRSIPVDVRIIAASNRPIADEIAQGRFRQDLYYRLNIINIYIPPLRERPEDIRLLVESFIERNNEVFQQNVKGITEGALELLSAHDWPGNVRELQNAVERAMAYGSGEGLLDREDFQRFGGFMEPQYGRKTMQSASQETVKEERRTVPLFADSAGPQGAAKGPGYDDARNLLDAKEDTEKKVVLATLRECAGNKSRAAQILGISRTMLYKKLEKYHIEG